MNVLCPIDFSDASKSGVEYAANLTKVLSAHLTLFYVRPSIWPEAVQLEQEAKRSAENISAQLLLFKKTVQKEFDISCDYEMEQTTDTIEMAIAAKASKYDLIVLGTKGADNLYQHLFGSNSFHVIEQTKCPVLIVPTGCAYQPVKRIVYAYDPKTNPIFQIDQLLGLAAPLKTEIRVLHILTEKRSVETERKMEILMKSVNAREKKQVPLSFDYQYSDEVTSALDSYVSMHRGDILALSGHHRSVLEKIFGENVVKQLSRVADYPVFVFWH